MADIIDIANALDCCTYTPPSDPEILRVYLHDPSLRIGDVVVKCDFCERVHFFTDYDLGSLNLDDDVSVFAATHIKGKRPKAGQGGLILRGVPEQPTSQERTQHE